jgi:hypothetical protein
VRRSSVVCAGARATHIANPCAPPASFGKICRQHSAATQTAGHISQQSQYVAFVLQPALAPSPGGSSRRHDEFQLQVQIGARIERQEDRVDWSTSPFVVTALMPRDAGNKGLRIGDRILSINGESIAHMPTSDALSYLLTGPLGTSVDIVVDRVTCAPQPLALHVPRSSVEEHFGGKVFGNGAVICEGWIAKDGRFSSTFKRRWARLVPVVWSTESMTGYNFLFSWGESASAKFVESRSVYLRVPGGAHSVSITPLDLPPHGQQLAAPSSNFGFNLHIGGRAINIFLDSLHVRDVWMRVLGMAQRTPECNCAYVFPGSIVTTNHEVMGKSPWITADAEMSGASIVKMDELRLAKLFLESQELDRSQLAAAKEEEVMREEQFGAQQERDRLQLQHIAACGSLTGGDVAALLHTTVARLHALERQNAMLRNENRAQNAIIHQFAAEMKQNQLQSALVFRQLAQALCSSEHRSTVGAKHADKFAVNILTDVLGAQHQQTVTASQNLVREAAARGCKRLR